MEAARTLNPTECEGFVVVDKHFNRAKVKSPQYVALNQMLNDHQHIERKILQVVVTNEGEGL